MRLSILGLALLAVAADHLVVGSARLARRFRVAPVHVVSSVPRREAPLSALAVAVFAVAVLTGLSAWWGAGLAVLVGNLLGSNLFNSLAGGAIVGFASPSAPEGVGVGPLVAMVAVSLLIWGIPARGLRVTRWEAGLLLTIYLATLPLLT